MIKVTKVELFANNLNGEPEYLERTELCPTGNIFVEWRMYAAGLMCAKLRINRPDVEGYFFTGKYYKRVKFYFDNGYVWDTLLKPTDEWRKMIYEELKKYVDSNGEDLPGEHQSELSRAARLLDDDMIYEI